MVKTNVSSGCSDSRVFIHASEWYYYFKSLLNDPNAAPLSFQENTEYASPEADVLNSEILPSGISSAIKKLSNGKSSGIDGIPSEFYKNTLHDILPILYKLFNSVFSTGNFPSTWSQSVICPIFKSGSKRNPANYRGISITTTMYIYFFFMYY